MQIRWPLVSLGFLLVSSLGVAALALAEDVGEFSRVVNQVEQLKQ